MFYTSDGVLILSHGASEESFSLPPSLPGLVHTFPFFAPFFSFFACHLPHAAKAQLYIFFPFFSPHTRRSLTFFFLLRDFLSWILGRGERWSWDWRRYTARRTHACVLRRHGVWFLGERGMGWGGCGYGLSTSSLLLLQLTTTTVLLLLQKIKYRTGTERPDLLIEDKTPGLGVFVSEVRSYVSVSRCLCFCALLVLSKYVRSRRRHSYDV
jgi:hypothetical protein